MMKRPVIVKHLPPSTPLSPPAPSVLSATPNESQLSKKTNNRWTEEEKTAILQTIRANPLSISWNEISAQFQRSEVAIKAMYYDNITPYEQVEQSVASVQYSHVAYLLQSLSFQCYQCRLMDYGTSHIWQDKLHCETCYNNLYAHHIQERWKLVMEYTIEKKKTSCNLCGKVAMLDQPLSGRFHYDHIDIFDKSGTICDMVKIGTSVDDIYREMDKCQLLCISCHKIVTKMEHQCGFIRLKKSSEDNEELRKQCSILYQSLMSRLYDSIRLVKSHNQSSDLLIPVPPHHDDDDRIQ
jgi:hypothetical protein